MKRFRSVAIGVLAAVAAVVVLQNLGTARARFLFYSVEAPLAALLAAQLAIGIALGFLLGWRRAGGKH